MYRYAWVWDSKLHAIIATDLVTIELGNRASGWLWHKSELGNAA